MTQIKKCKYCKKQYDPLESRRNMTKLFPYNLFCSHDHYEKWWDESLKTCDKWNRISMFFLAIALSAQLTTVIIILSILIFR